MATKNAINNVSNPLTSTAVTVDPGVSGDSHVQFDINGTGEFRVGVDDDASDVFKISQGNSLGTNDTFIMTSDGERTMPLQPAFSGMLNTQDDNVTGAGATYTLGSGNALTKIFDQGSNFTTAGVFTAPVTGRYFLYASVRSRNVVGGMTDSVSKIVTSNRTYLSGECDAGACVGGAIGASIPLHYQTITIADMDATDTATSQLIISNGGGNTVDIRNLNSNATTYICGYLMV